MGLIGKVRDLQAKAKDFSKAYDKKVGPGGIRKMPSMKEGGMVAMTKPHMLHKGEMVVPAHLVKHFHRLLVKK